MGKCWRACPAQKMPAPAFTVVAMEKCFACEKKLGKNPAKAITEDYAQIVAVGSECARKIYGSANGYQPPLGGPRLFPIKESDSSCYKCQSGWCQDHLTGK